MLKTILIKLAHKFKSFPYFGRQRFWILYWAYKLTGWHIRHEEWDFVLGYLPKLHHQSQSIYLMDVGCAKSLFDYELNWRGYNYLGIDLKKSSFQKRPYFFEKDITEWNNDGLNDFVTCISVLEHIGNDGRGDFAEQRIAIRNMVYSLRVGGRLLLTTPTTEFAKGDHPWHGFTWQDINNLLPTNVLVVERTERAGQICIAVERVS